MGPHSVVMYCRVTGTMQHKADEHTNKTGSGNTVQTRAKGESRAGGVEGGRG